MSPNEFEEYCKILNTVDTWKVTIYPDDYKERNYFIEIRNEHIIFRSPVFPNIDGESDPNAEVFTTTNDKIPISLAEWNAINQIIMNSESLIKDHIEKKRMKNPYIKAILYLEDIMKLTENNTLQDAIDLLENAPNKK